MVATNAGTGHRLSPRCFACARAHAHIRPRIGYDLKLTGRRRAKLQYKPHSSTQRIDPRFQYEVQCLTCGHVGWNRHADLARDWQEKFGTVTEIT